MGNCLPCMAHEPKRSKHISQNSVVPRIQFNKLETYSKNTPTPPSKDLPKHQILPNCTIQEDKEKGVIRVKMVMTKKEAAQLLSKLANGQERVVERIMSELRRADDRTSRPIRLGPSRDTWRPALESIPENQIEGLLARMLPTMWMVMVAGH